MKNTQNILNDNHSPNDLYDYVSTALFPKLLERSIGECPIKIELLDKSVQLIYATLKGQRDNFNNSQSPIVSRAEVLDDIFNSLANALLAEEDVAVNELAIVNAELQDINKN